MTATRRRSNVGELESSIEAWTSARDCWDRALELQSVGVDAAPVANHDDFRERDGLPSNDYQIPFENEHLNTYPGPAARLNGQTPTVRLGPPRLGEHTAEILSELLGIGAGDVDDLRSRDIV